MDSSSGRPKIRSRCRNVVPTPSGPGEVRRISAAPLQGGSFSKSLTKANTCSTGRLITTLCCNPAISIAPCIRSTAGVHRTGRTSRHRYGHRYGDRRTPSLWAQHRRPGSHHSNLSAIVRSGFCNCEYVGGGSGGSLAGLASAPRHDWLCNWHPVVVRFPRFSGGRITWFRRSWQPSVAIVVGLVLVRAAPTETPLDAVGVVPAVDVAKQRELGLLAGAEAGPVDQLDLQGGEEVLGQGVVVAVTH